MKPFDLEKAKNGAAVCMRDGMPVKILDFEFDIGNAKVILFKYYSKQRERDITMTTDLSGSSDNVILFMAPTIAYAVIYKNTNSQELYSGKLVPTKEEAETTKDSVYPELEKFCIAKIEMLDD